MECRYHFVHPIEWCTSVLGWYVYVRSLNDVPEIGFSLKWLLFCAETEKGIFDAILKEEVDFDSQPWPSISNSAKDLVQKMLTKDPRRRITSSQVLGNLSPL